MQDLPADHVENTVISTTKARSLFPVIQNSCKTIEVMPYYGSFILWTSTVLYVCAINFSIFVPSNLPIWPICKLADWSADLQIALHNLPIIQESV